MYQPRWYISFNINYIVFFNTKLRITGQNQGVLYTQCFDQFSSPCHWLLPWLLWRCRGCYFYKCQEKPLKFTLVPPRWISKAPQDINNRIPHFHSLFYQSSQTKMQYQNCLDLQDTRRGYIQHLSLNGLSVESATIYREWQVRKFPVILGNNIKVSPLKYAH